jgi:putative endonuclease
VRSGEVGERYAERHLRKLGMKLLERNLRAAGGEIDLVAFDRGTFVFVEVKSRSSERFGRPEEAVDRAKRRNVARAAREFLKRKGLLDRPRRYDVAAVRLDDRGRPVSIDWTKSAFEEADLQ